MIEIRDLSPGLGAAVVAAVPALTPTATADARREEPKSIVAAFAAEVLTRRDFSRLDVYMRPDYIQHNPLVAQGSRGFRDFFAAWFGASPDFKHEVKQIAVEGDRVWVYGTYSGTHAGDWLGIPATGRTYSFDAVDIFRLEDGRLAEHWDVLDVHGLFTQLGVVT